MTTATTVFKQTNEFGFLEFLEENQFFERELTQGLDSPISELENHVRNIAKKLDSRRDHYPAEVKPFYQNAGFVWVYATTGEAPNQRITDVALLRFPNEVDAKGELIYFDTETHADTDALKALREAALKAAGTWYEGVLTPHRLGLWRDLMNLALLEFIDEPVKA